jgi:hypothetical protein
MRRCTLAVQMQQLHPVKAAVALAGPGAHIESRACAELSACACLIRASPLHICQAFLRLCNMQLLVVTGCQLSQWRPGCFSVGHVSLPDGFSNSGSVLLWLVVLVVIALMACNGKRGVAHRVLGGETFVHKCRRSHHVEACTATETSRIPCC